MRFGNSFSKMQILSLESSSECPNCQASVLSSDRFCEGCGQLLVNSPACPQCGAAAWLDAEGYCSQCGLRAERAADPVEIQLSAELAGFSHRGLVHSQNEDALALYASQQTQILVVCDGVSCSYRPQLAAQLAAQTVCQTLVEQLAASPPACLLVSLSAAIAQAQRAVAAIAYPPGAEPPATTVVAAVCRAGVAAIGWLGDSRAYWIAAGAAPVQLSRDHAGNGHGITRWLGDDGDLDVPDIVTLPLASSGCLILCSDGFWNYLENPASLASLISFGEDAATISRRLVDYACTEGGHDNVTAAVFKFSA